MRNKRVFIIAIIKYDDKAKIVNSKEKLIEVPHRQDKKKAIGYRLWSDGKTTDMPENWLLSMPNNNNWLINAEMDKNAITGTNGSLERYGVIQVENTGNKKITKNAMVIIKKYGLIDKNKQTSMTVFQVVDANGNIEMCTADKAVEYAEGMGIANGKLVSKGDSKYISAISGEYHYEEVSAEEFIKDHKILGYHATATLMKGDLSTHAKENTIINIVASEKPVLAINEAFNRGVKKVLAKHKIPYSEKEFASGSPFGHKYIRYAINVNGEECLVQQSYAFIKLTGDKACRQIFTEIVLNMKDNSLYHDESFDTTMTHNKFSSLGLTVQQLEADELANREKLAVDRTEKLLSKGSMLALRNKAKEIEDKKSSIVGKFKALWSSNSKRNNL